MPRGKRIVYAAFCAETGERLGTFRFFKQDKLGKSFKDHAEKLTKYNPTLRKKVALKLKEERHSK